MNRTPKMVWTALMEQIHVIFILEAEECILNGTQDCSIIVIGRFFDFFYQTLGNDYQIGYSNFYKWLFIAQLMIKTRKRNHFYFQNVGWCLWIWWLPFWWSYFYVISFKRTWWWYVFHDILLCNKNYKSSFQMRQNRSHKLKMWMFITI